MADQGPEGATGASKAGETGSGFSLKAILDILVKLVASGVAIAAVLIANNFQSDLAARSLLNQREQSESALRAAMFGHLIAPIVGPQKEGEIAADRERLLVELMALNFHEHFEFKPLMLHADGRLAKETGGGMTAAERTEARASLRSIAKRVKERQVAFLGEDHVRAKPCRSGGPAGPATVSFTLIEVGKESVPFPEAPGPSRYFSQFTRSNGTRSSELFEVTSPDCARGLRVVFLDPDWKDYTVAVQIQEAVEGAKFEFTLSPFDLPFTDNRLLADGNRFALFIDEVEVKKLAPARVLKVKLLWFPKEYFPPRERPTDYQEVRKLIGGGRSK